MLKVDSDSSRSIVEKKFKKEAYQQCENGSFMQTCQQIPFRLYFSTRPAPLNHLKFDYGMENTWTKRIGFHKLLNLMAANHRDCLRLQFLL